MRIAVKAIYRNGIIKPLEKIDIDDGAEITIAVSEPVITGADGIKKKFWWMERVDRCGPISERYLRKPWT